MITHPRNTENRTGNSLPLTFEHFFLSLFQKQIVVVGAIFFFRCICGLQIRSEIKFHVFKRSSDYTEYYTECIIIFYYRISLLLKKDCIAFIFEKLFVSDLSVLSFNFMTGISVGFMG